MLRIANEEDTFDGIEVGGCDAWKGIDGRSSTLRIALQNEAFIGVGEESAGDFVNDVLGAL